MSDVKPSILVVEDENVVAMDLVTSLEKLHYGIVGIASSGEQAIELAGRQTPHLVLMDIHLRGEMDGIEAAQHIQNQFNIPVVFLTAYSDEATLGRARITHPFGYVLKPFEDREIEVAIQIAMFRHHMELALRDNQQRLDSILSSIGDAVIATDTERRVTFVNRAAEHLIGWSSARAEGRLASDLLRAASRDDGTVMLLRGRDTIPVELIETPLVSATGVATGYVVIVRDMSDRLRAQEAHERELVERAARAAAERDHERARLKSEMSLALADITQIGTIAALRRVAELVVRSVARVCVLEFEDFDGATRLTAQASAGAVIWTETPIARSGEDEIGEHHNSVQMFDRVPEHVRAVLRSSSASARIAEATSCIEARMRARQRVVGTLVLVGHEGHTYDGSDLMFARQVADRVALALDNARLYREAQEAKTIVERLYLAEQRARSEAQALFRIAESLNAAQLDVETLVQRVTDESTALVGAEYGAFFYNVFDEHGQAYMLYTLSGAPREPLERLGLPKVTPLFAPTFGGEGIVRCDDVHEDPRYGKMGPHHGMPEGHLEVTSYLAIPVVSRTGSVIGGLFFAHRERGMFTEQHERMGKALAAHAAVAIENARLFTETRNAEERQSRLVRDLERTVRFSEMFVGILGHDLRNPLSGITMAASVALKRAESERVTKPLSRILSSADRMSRMIDQILDFTRIRLGRGIPLQRKAVDFAELCRTALDELKDDSEDASSLRLESVGDAVGVWDGDRLSQLVSNLVGNALQHRPRETPVSVRIDGTNHSAVSLEVRNEGVIPPEIVSVIFEPLRGGGGGSGHKVSRGLGLGLYITQQIVVAHGGAILVESEPAAGTRFRVELPRIPPAQAEQVFHPQEGPE